MLDLRFKIAINYDAQLPLELTQKRSLTRCVFLYSDRRQSTHKRHWSQIYEWQHTQGKRTVDTREPTDTTDVHKILQNQPKLTPSLASIVLNPFQWYVSISKTKQRSSYGKE